MTTARALRIGTRGSQLALWQARTVAELLGATGTPCELLTIRTAGDRLQQAPLAEVGGKRLFVREIEDALLRGDIDLAVHSAKDMPALLPDGLELGAALAREDPRDALVLPAGSPAGELTAVLTRFVPGPAIGTSSVRRVAQLSALLPAATFTPVRGNVDTRLRKLDGGGFHGLVLAAAGLLRLGFGSRISATIPLEQCVPAPGQGIVAVEIRGGDQAMKEVLRAIHDIPAGVSLAAERALVAALGGGCQLPLGGIAVHHCGELEMRAVVASPDGTRAIRAQACGPSADPGGLGRRVAEDLVRGGAMEILDDVRRVQGPVEGSY